MTLSTTLTLKLAADQSSALDLGTRRASIADTFSRIFASGTGAGQADLIFADTRTLAASANEDLDLAGTALTDAFGAALSFVKVRGLIVAAAPGNTNQVVVGGAATNGFVTPFGSATDKVKIGPGGVLALFTGLGDLNGYGVTAATGDLLRVTNGGAGTSVTYDVIVVGTSA